LFVESDALGAIVTETAGVELKQQQLFRAETRIDVREIDERAEIEGGAGEQYQSQTDLCADEGFSYFQSRYAEGAAALESADGIHATGPQRWEQSGQHRGD